MELVIDNVTTSETYTDDCTQFNSIEEIIADFKQGKMVIILDDEDRENEGDLLMAADKVTDQDINFMAKFGRGLICLTLTEKRCQQLNLPLMVSQNEQNNAPFGTRFTMSVEAAQGVTTGISAKDRATTIKACIKSDALPSDIVQPGHIFPIMAQPGGVLTRAGHTETGCDLARLSGFNSEAAVLVEILNEDGSMARRNDLMTFAKQHNLKIGTVADLIKYRLQNEQTVEQISTTVWPTKYGDFKLNTYLDHVSGQIHYALVSKNFIASAKNSPMVRVHVENKITDVLAYDNYNTAASSGWPLDKSIEYIAENGNGVVLILSNEQNPKDILNIINKIKNNSEKDNNKQQNKNIEQKILRRIGIGSQILSSLGITRMKLLSEPVRYQGLSGFNLEIEQYIKFEG